MTYTISLITGDGIGPELSDSVCDIFETIHDKLGLHLNLTRLEAGDTALKHTGYALPDDTMNKIKHSDACLKAPVGESAADVIVVLRQQLDLYANIRPAKSYPFVPAIYNDVDLVIVRENTEDLYVGKEFFLGPTSADIGNIVVGKNNNDNNSTANSTTNAAVALRIISERASRRIAKHAFEMAMLRNKKVTCVHKSNVMRVTDGLFAKACADVGSSYPDVTLEQMYVDACAMNLVKQPQMFDVILTTNLFGDILSDESSQIVGGLGVAASSNVGDNFALFEPVHGAAFDIAGKNIANPVSFILSAKLMLDWLGRKHNDTKCFDVGDLLTSTIQHVIRDGGGTLDVGGNSTTTEFTRKIISKLLNA